MNRSICLAVLLSACNRGCGADVDTEQPQRSSSELRRPGGHERPELARPRQRLPQRPSPGCALSQAHDAGKYQIDVAGTSRTYWTNRPTTGSAPMPIVIGLTGRGGLAEDLVPGFFGLRETMPDALFVAPQANGDGWHNTDGEDVAFVGALLDELERTDCTDTARVFVVGHSFGGTFAATLACALGSRLRAFAPLAGWLKSHDGDGTATCVWEPVALLSIAGLRDKLQPIENSRLAFDVWSAVNRCGPELHPLDEHCTERVDCDVPSVWCEHDGGHETPSFSSEAIGSFFQSF